MKIVLLGAGQVARRHGRLLRGLGGKAVEVWVASRDRGRGDDLRAEIKAAGVYASYDDAYAGDADAIVICTPPHLHLAQARAALAAGKHIVLEKPPLPRAADFDALVAIAGTRRIFVAENYFYKPSLARLRALVTDGVVGDPLFVHVNAIKRQTIAADDWRADPTRALGGALYEGGIHWINVMSNLGLAVERVHGFAPRPRPGVPEQSMMVGFDYREGAAGMLSYSWEVPSTLRGVRLSKIYGRAGTITFESNGLWVFAHGTRTRPYFPGLRDLAGYRAMWRDFLAAWRDGRDAVFTLDHARRDLALIEAAYQSAGLPLPATP